MTQTQTVEWAPAQSPPNEHGLILVAANGDVFEAQWAGYFATKIFENRLVGVTHWMPLPKHPDQLNEP